jgi:ABC-2 type transport system permease protein
MLPRFLQQIAPLWPSYHLDRLALAAVGMRQDALLPHVLVLLGIASAFWWLAARRLRKFG